MKNHFLSSIISLALLIKLFAAMQTSHNFLSLKESE